MEQLWAPWRSGYVQRDGDESSATACFLCDAGQQHQAHEPTFVIGVSTYSVVMLNKFPYSAGHLMVVPRRHVATLTDLSQDEYVDLMNAVRQSVEIIDQVYKPHGCNVGINLGAAAGAGVPDHVHIHVIPRWEGDTNFMTTIAQTRVISQELRETWARLAPYFSRVSQA